MKTFKQTDTLSDLRVGDTLTLADGSVHLAVDDREQDITYGCLGCSVSNNGMWCQSDNLCDSCTLNDFNFKQIKP